MSSLITLGYVYNCDESSSSVARNDKMKIYFLSSLSLRQKEETLLLSKSRKPVSQVNNNKYMCV